MLPLTVLAVKSWLKLVNSCSFATGITRHTLPSSDSTANQLSHTKYHCWFVWISLTVTRLRYQDGDKPMVINIYGYDVKLLYTTIRLKYWDICSLQRHFIFIKGTRQYIYFLFHLKELLKLYANLLHRLFAYCLVFEIFSLKIISCPPSWINSYLIGDFSDVKSRVSHIKLHLNDRITVSLVWKVVRHFL